MIRRTPKFFAGPGAKRVRRAVGRGRATRSDGREKLLEPKGSVKMATLEMVVRALVLERSQTIAVFDIGSNHEGLIS